MRAPTIGPQALARVRVARVIPPSRPGREIFLSVFYFVLVTVNNDALGLFEFERADWKPGDVIPGGEPSLRVVDVLPPQPRKGDGLEVGLLKVEPA